MNQVFSVLEGALSLEVDEDLVPLVPPSWIPLGDIRDGNAPARVRVSHCGSPGRLPGSVPTLTLGTVKAWIQDGSALLSGAGGCRGEVDMNRHQADLIPPGQPAEDVPPDLYSMLTITTALLLGGFGYALVHAAGVVSPEGIACLLVGDARSGKSTTCANLVRKGWNYLSDDQVVLKPESSPGRVSVHGVLRPFHLDDGWVSGASPRHQRRTVDSFTLGPGTHQRSAPLGRLLFPRVVPGAATSLSPLHPGDAMTRLIRQSPWLLADRRSAAAVLGVLAQAAQQPAWALHLGLDTYHEPRLLEERLLGAFELSEG